MTKKIGRNQPCPCSSSKKYKHCCGKRTARKKTHERQKSVKGWTGSLRAIPITVCLPRYSQRIPIPISTPEDVFEKLRVPLTEGDNDDL